MSPDDPEEPPGGTSRSWSPQSWRDDPDRELDWARERDRERDRDRERARAAREREEQRRRDQEREARARERARQEREARETREARDAREPEVDEREQADWGRAEREPASTVSAGRTRLARVLRQGPAPSKSGRGRRVRRTVRHLDPWSVLKVALLFNTAVFLIVCVASALLWGGARASGTLDDAEHFITSLGFGNCKGDPGAATESDTTATSTPVGSTGGDQFGNGAATTTEPTAPKATVAPAQDDGDDDCPPGEHLEGGFKFEDIRVFEVFAFGGVVMVLASTGAMVVLALLFNLMSDLTGGVGVWVVEDEPRQRRDSGSPPSKRRG